jgi:hypothetical protein
MVPYQQSLSVRQSRAPGGVSSVRQAPLCISIASGQTERRMLINKVDYFQKTGLILNNSAATFLP